MKPNWVCSDRGMWSNRKSSVKRHIVNLYNGDASLVAFIDYVVGRPSGIYQASSSSSHLGTIDLEYQRKTKKQHWGYSRKNILKKKHD